MTATADRTALDLLLDGVEGFLHPDEPAFLASLAAQVPAHRCIVEIGSYRGRSTIALAYGAPDGVLVYAVDPHEQHEAGGYTFGMADNQAFMANVSRAGLGHKIRAVNLDSETAFDALKSPLVLVGLVFIDGAHDLNSVRADVNLWGGIELCEGGMLAIHDSAGTWEHPTTVADYLSQSRDWTELDGCAYTRVFRKREP